MTNRLHAQRRQVLMDTFGEGTAIVIPSSTHQPRSRDTSFPFRQDSDFFYLTGFNEPNSWLLLRPGADDAKSILFCRPRNRKTEIWDGWRVGPERITERFGIESGRSVDEFDSAMPELLEGCDRIVVDFANQTVMTHVQRWQQALQRKSRLGVVPAKSIEDLTQVLHEHRLFKDQHEVSQMKKAAALSVSAHRRAMQSVKPGMYEYELEALYLHEFMSGGARYPAYSTIVGGGANAVVLHYVENSDALKAGDLVLVDAGAEYQGYAADITRTFPVSGVYSPEQKALYEVVLQAQMDALEACRPGNTFICPHDRAVKTLTEGLIELGLLKGTVQSNIEEGHFKKYYMHRTGHWLGLDVHDVGRYKVNGTWRALEPGMVLTVEPGLYVAQDDDTVDAKWRGIGIRIEDDVLITHDGHENLTAGVPKTIAAVEALMNERL